MMSVSVVCEGDGVSAAIQVLRQIAWGKLWIAHHIQVFVPLSTVSTLAKGKE